MLVRTADAAKPCVRINGKRVCRVTEYLWHGHPQVARPDLGGFGPRLTVGVRKKLAAAGSLPCHRSTSGTATHRWPARINGKRVCRVTVLRRPGVPSVATSLSDWPGIASPVVCRAFGSTLRPGHPQGARPL